MLKVNALILTLALGAFSLFLNEVQSDFAFKKDTSTPHDIKINHAFNTLAISTTNSFQEFAGSSKEKELTNNTKFFAKNAVTKSVFDTDLLYLKVCELVDLNLTTRTIIYPFHSFL